MVENAKENDLNVIEKYVCATYDPDNHFHTNDVNRIRFLLFTKSSDNKLRKLPPTREVQQPRFLCSVYAVGWIWDVTLQRSDQILSQVDWGWKYCKYNRLAVDWCGAYYVIISYYVIMFTYTCKKFSLMQMCNERSITSSVLQLCLYCVTRKYCWIVYLYIYRGVFTTQSNIYDRIFLREQ